MLKLHQDLVWLRLAQAMEAKALLEGYSQKIEKLAEKDSLEMPMFLVVKQKAGQPVDSDMHSKAHCPSACVVQMVESPSLLRQELYQCAQSST